MLKKYMQLNDTIVDLNKSNEWFQINILVMLHNVQYDSESCG